jgi:hypothetical protein
MTTDAATESQKPWLFASLRGYCRGWLTKDVIAGLTVWAVLVPESVAFLALVAGVAPSRVPSQLHGRPRPGHRRFLTMGRAGQGALKSVFVWMIEHERALSAGTMFFVGSIFVGRGLGGLL